MGFFKKLLKIAAPVAGFAFGGPAGAALGGALTSGSSGGSSGAAAPSPLDALKNSPALGTGLSNLNEILLSQGKVDPATRNRSILGVRRGTEAQQVGQSQSAAQRGLQNSGVSQAINAAIGASGEDRVAAVEADFVKQEEERKRSDLLMLLQLIINPSIQREAIGAQRDVGFAGINQQARGATIGGISSLLSGLLNSFNSGD